MISALKVTQVPYASNVTFLISEIKEIILNPLHTNAMTAPSKTAILFYFILF